MALHPFKKNKRNKKYTKYLLKTKTKTKKLVDKSELVFVNPNFFIKHKDILKRIFFTLMVLLIIRAGTYVTVPGVKVNINVSDLSTSNQFFGLISLLGGGTLGKFSILALGVSPYITASIIVQLLSTDVIPILTRWSKSGAKGRKKLDRLTKYLTVPFALMQGIATIFTMANQKVITPKWESAAFGSGPATFYYILVPCVLLAGTMLMWWLGDQITLRGVGNGISLIIFGGVVARLPFSMEQTFKFWISGKEANNILFLGIVKFSVYILAFLVIILLVVLLNESERRIPIQQTGSGLIDDTKTSKNKPYLPLKVNSAGVIPVIFASALISAPVTISQIIKNSNPNNGFVQFTNNYLSFQTWYGIALYWILTVMFTFLYAQVQINPLKVSENFQKSGTFIPGVKPGKETEKYLSGVVMRLSIIGSLFLASVAVCPYIISKVTSLPRSLAIGGTGMIIMVSVGLQTLRQIQGFMTQQAFISKKNQTIMQTNGNASYVW